jgi:CHASE2 domain-containing sensor protein
MRLSNAIQAAGPWRSGLVGAALAIGVGLLFWLTRLGDGLQNLSYDLQFLLKRPVVPTEAVIVYVDEKSCQELGQDPKRFDRALYARLLDRLAADQARWVVFDVVFAELRESKSDDALASAIQRNGKVLLAAIEDVEVRPGAVAASLIRPVEKFRAVSAGWGIAALETEVVKRRFRPIRSLGTNLAYVAAVLAEPSVPRTPPTTNDVFWLNFYGPQGTLPNVSFCEARDQPEGFFRDKVVFVGGKPTTPHLFDQAEENQTPLTRWGDNYFPGVDVLTTGFLNVLRGESLHRLPSLIEVLILVLVGLVSGIGLTALRPWLAVVISLTLVLLLISLLVWLFVGRHFWFPWALPLVVQLPCALLWGAYHRMAVRKAGPVKAHAQARSEAAAQAVREERATVAGVGAELHRETLLAPAIPDHTLLRRVGSGAYGSVWLARNAVGIYRAVKIVYLSAFSTGDPYEREFRGISKFMPVSLKHPKLVHLLHVGRNDRDGYFYYIMEAADDEISGQEITPGSYCPRNLSREIARRGRLPALECLDLGMDLASALDFLHQSQLIHRDIKPANIIYTGGIPKIADIGLVTDISTKPEDTSYVGTEGFIPPEGPGTAMGDVYSLGKVLYQALTGLRIDEFPVLPTTLVNRAEDAGFLGMNDLILRACESDVAERYQTAAALRTDLERLKKELVGGSPQ